MRATILPALRALCLFAAMSLAAEVITQAPHIIHGTPITDAKAVSKYKGIFQTWRFLNIWDCSPCVEIAPGILCPCNGWNNTQQTAQPAAFSSAPASTTATIDHSYVSAAGTATRTILVRSPDESAHKEHPEGSISSAVQAAGTHSPNARVKDVTNWFWEDQIAGYDSRIMPITIEHPTTPSGEQTEPIVLLAWVNTTVFSSFISLPLVQDLNLSSIVRPMDEKPAYLPERDLTKLFGAEIHAVGVIDLHLLAGIHDKGREARFIVANGPSDKTGALQIDVMLGMNLLNSLGAVGLTSEYTGSDAAGAKEGLGILVERVIRVESPNHEEHSHDEL